MFLRREISIYLSKCVVTTLGYPHLTHLTDLSVCLISALDAVETCIASSSLSTKVIVPWFSCSTVSDSVNISSSSSELRGPCSTPRRAGLALVLLSCYYALLRWVLVAGLSAHP